MNIFKMFTLKWWQVGVFKWRVLACRILPLFAVSYYYKRRLFNLHHLIYGGNNSLYESALFYF